MIDRVTNGDSLPVLERLMQFAGERHRIIANNIANIDTPNFRPVDVSVDDFQEKLGEAIDARRTEWGAGGGPLEIESTNQVEVNEHGLVLHADPIGDNILFHDGNDRNPERLMQSLVENFMSFRFAAEMLKSRYELINTAIRERM